MIDSIGLMSVNRSNGILITTSNGNSQSVVMPLDKASAGFFPDSTRFATMSHWKAEETLPYCRE